MKQTNSKDHSGIDGATASDRPNYWLILIGLVLAAVALLLRGQMATPLSLAFFFAVSLTFLLYGLYPVSAVAKGAFGKLQLVGPAALGVFLFLTVWRLLLPSGMPEFIVLQNTDARLRSHELPGGDEITLIDVDSLTDDGKIGGVLRDINETLNIGDYDSAQFHPDLKAVFGQTLVPLRFGPARKTALDLVDRYAQGETIDNDWKALVAELASQSNDEESFLNRVDRSPFAILKIEENGDFRIEVLTPKGQLRVGNERFGVPIIANPREPVTGQILEAVVLQAR